MWKHGVKMQSGFTWFRISTSGRSPVATSLNLLDLCTRCAWVGNKRTSLSSLVRLSQGIGWDSGEVRTLQREKKKLLSLPPGIEPQCPILSKHSTTWATPAHNASRPTRTKFVLPRNPKISRDKYISVPLSSWWSRWRTRWLTTYTYNL